MRIGSLCSGMGGLEMGVQAAIGGETAWVSDIDKGACKILAHRLPGVPNIGDMTTVDWSQVEPVDVLTAGFPCQPVSHAGKQRGDLDERWLWDDVARAVSDLRPGLVVLENVRGLLAAGYGRLFGRVLGALAERGYDAQWRGVRAADVGAPHGRWRVFIVARDTHGAGLEGRWAGGRTDQRPAGPSGVEPHLILLPTPAVNDMGAGKTVEAWDAWTVKMQAAHGNGNGHGKSLHIEAQRFDRWGQYEPAIKRWQAITGRPAPAPTEPTAAGRPQLSPAFVEFLMGLPAGWVTDVPGITRNEALRALGNGVVPQQATAALRYLLGAAVDGAVA